MVQQAINGAIDFLECAICQESHTGDKWVTLPCGHCYHEKCVARALRGAGRPKCPICRYKLKLPDEPTRLYDISTCEIPHGSTSPGGAPEPPEEPTEPWVAEGGEEGSLGALDSEGHRLLRQRVRDAEAMGRKLKAEVQQLETENRKLAGENRDLMGDRQGLQATNKDLVEEMRDLTVAHGSLSKKLADTKGKAAALAEGLHAATVERQAAESAVASLSKKLKVAEQQVFRMKLRIPDFLSNDDEATVLKRVGELYSAKHAQNPLVVELFNCIESHKKNYQSTTRQFSEDMKKLQTEKRKTDNDLQKLKAERSELARALREAKQQLQQQEQERARGPLLGEPPSSPQPGGKGLAGATKWLHDALDAQWDEDDDDLLIVGEHTSQEGEAGGAALQPSGAERRPSFMVRPDGGQRPPAMPSGLAGSRGFILQGADGRGGRTTLSSTIRAPSASFLNAKRQQPNSAPVSIKGTSHNGSSSSMQMLPLAKRPRVDHKKRVATQDITNYLNRGKENSAN